MIETLLAAKDIADYEKKKLEDKPTMILDFILNEHKEPQKNDIEVSPFILENITNQLIFVDRKGG